MTDEFRQELAASRKARKPIEFKLISINEDVRFGKACICNSRFTVGDLVGKISLGMSFDEIIDDFPELTKEGIIEALEFVQAKENFDNIVLLNSPEQL